ncbi:MAG: hypothetical protein GY953_46925, partial [bacterium]|nr:hypothetical protein [bacterium]
KWGNILCSPTAGTGINFFLPHGGGAITLGGFTLPSDIALYGFCYCVQALCGDNPFGYLSNALIQTIG